MTQSFPSLQSQDTTFAMPSLQALSGANDGAEFLAALLADDAVSEIMVNGCDRVYIEKSGRLQETGIRFDSADMLDRLVQMLLRRCGKEDALERMRVIDGVLSDGSRVHIVLPPVAVDGPSISIRKFPKNAFTLSRLVAEGFLSSPPAFFLQHAVASRVNLLVAGNASSGKTTLLNALSAFIAPAERIVTIEDTAELQLQQNNVVRLETAGLPGQPHYTMRELVRASLRMRPDRIIIGEVRGPEAYDLLQAMNTGHQGSMCTIHANNPREALSRLEQMVTAAGFYSSSRHIREQISSCINLIVQVERSDSSARRITHITEVVGIEGEKLTLQDLFVYKENAQGKGYVFGNLSSRNPRIEAALQQCKQAQAAAQRMEPAVA